MPSEEREGRSAADYEALALEQLRLAAKAENQDERRTHLDQAAVYATLSEKARSSEEG